MRRKRQQNFAAVGTAARALQQTASLQAVHQFDCAVVLDLQTLREHSDGRPLRCRETLDGQQCLMLLGFHPGVTSRLFTEIYEPANFVAELRERLIVEFISREFVHRHLHIIS